MLSRRKLLKRSKIYLILDTQVNTYQELFEIAKQVIDNGVTIFQLRDKNGDAKAILEFSRKMIKLTAGRALYIVNDRLDLALLSGADGVHLGQEDIDIADARKILNKQFLVGKSCQTYARARKAEQEGADYIGFGSVYKTLTKPGRNPMDLELLSKVYRNISLPVFAIGGIETSNLKQLLSLGVDRIAVCRAICRHKNPALASQNFHQLMGG
ncbi:MAG: thiamine phosphate synthase [Candidatus Omnitrophica bacterium]|nr:thiamine phosphate synthase [Candidatus Omnitrophota bacterium]